MEIHNQKLHLRNFCEAWLVDRVLRRSDKRHFPPTFRTAPTGTKIVERNTVLRCIKILLSLEFARLSKLASKYFGAGILTQSSVPQLMTSWMLGRLEQSSQSENK